MTIFTLDGLAELVRRLAGDEAAFALITQPPDTALQELGIDSMILIRLVELLHDRYGVPIPDEATHDLGTARQAVDYVNTHQPAVRHATI